MNLFLGLFKIPKNNIKIGQKLNRRSRVVGAKNCASRPRVGVCPNLINGTYKGFYHE
jgi:hypothetical protein